MVSSCRASCYDGRREGDSVLPSAGFSESFSLSAGGAAASLVPASASTAASVDLAASDAVTGAFSKGDGAAAGAVAVSSAMDVMVVGVVVGVEREVVQKSGDVMSETVFRAATRKQKELSWRRTSAGARQSRTDGKM